MTKFQNSHGNGHYNATAPSLSDGDEVGDQYDVNGNKLISLGTLIAGEDLTNNVLKTEERFSYYKATADGQVKSGSGFIHTVTFSATGTVTAGVITIYDNTAESGTVIWTGTIQTGLNPITITLDELFNTACYIGYDATIANVAVNASYR